VSPKVKTVEELSGIVARARSSGQKVVFTNGCFDLLHRGHIQTLRGARALGDLLIVALNTDRSVKMLKGPRRPVLPEEDRIELIAAMEMVDYVTLFDEPDPQRLIEALRPDVLAKGGDWSADQVIGGEIVAKSGGEVALIPYIQGISTTAIIERIRS
jgi:rfaE bifunctional protein nucleotidyltransferase chain/domain